MNFSQAYRRIAAAQAIAAALLLALLLLPTSRHVLEASMWLHMLVQFPLLLLVGMGLVGVLPARVQAGVACWNAHGISGLLAVVLVPRVLDLALVSPSVDAAKCSALLLAGARVQRVFAG